MGLLSNIMVDGASLGNQRPKALLPEPRCRTPKLELLYGSPWNTSCEVHMVKIPQETELRVIEAFMQGAHNRPSTWTRRQQKTPVLGRKAWREAITEASLASQQPSQAHTSSRNRLLHFAHQWRPPLWAIRALWPRRAVPPRLHPRSRLLKSPCGLSLVFRRDFHPHTVACNHTQRRGQKWLSVHRQRTQSGSAWGG